MRINTLSEFLKRFPVISRVRTQWGEMDAFQHVNNTVYFKYQEAARLKYFETVCKSIKDPNFDLPGFRDGSGLGPILAETHVKFIYPLGAYDTILIGAEAVMVEDSLSKFKLKHSIWSLTHNRVCAEGGGTVTSFNYSSGKVQDFHPAFVRAMHELSTKNCSHLEEMLKSPID